MIADSKFFLASKSILGPLLGFVGAVFAVGGVDLTPADQEAIQDGVQSVVDAGDMLWAAGSQLVGLIVGIYGRFKADTAVRLVP